MHKVVVNMGAPSEFNASVKIWKKFFLVNFFKTYALDFNWAPILNDHYDQPINNNYNYEYVSIACVLDKELTYVWLH